MSTGQSTGAPLPSREHRRSSGAPDNFHITAGQPTGQSTGATGATRAPAPTHLFREVGAMPATPTTPENHRPQEPA